MRYLPQTGAGASELPLTRSCCARNRGAKCPCVCVSMCLHGASSHLVLPARPAAVPVPAAMLVPTVPVPRRVVAAQGEQEPGPLCEATAQRSRSPRCPGSRGQAHAAHLAGVRCRPVASTRATLLSATLMLFTAFCLNAVGMPNGIAS